MNKALSLANWKRGGRHYILKAASDNKWVGFQESVIRKLKAKFGDDFFLVIWSDKAKENDFFNIPFRKVATDLGSDTVEANRMMERRMEESDLCSEPMQRLGKLCGAKIRET